MSFHLVSSVHDVKHLINLYGCSEGLEVRVEALHGLSNARSVHTLLMKQIRRMGWRVDGLRHLEVLVGVHMSIASAARHLDKLVLYFETLTAPGSGGDPVDVAAAPGHGGDPVNVAAPGLAVPSPGEDLATTNSNASFDPASTDDDHHDGVNNSEGKLGLATRLHEAGAAILQHQLSCPDIAEIVQLLGGQLQDGSNAIVHQRFLPEKLLAYIKEAKNNLQAAWLLWVEHDQFKML
ncbi:uncharacterized protein LOC107304952 [Oryza brachyantha]|uniref:Uncharacterized protein n=1 Tax=Oryza brachyantha TaxID=4533 RepID=J3MYV5_ORYBR|nr:uncharacterized protein LOC107304952 [Oryza brachyantha]